VAIKEARALGMPLYLVGGAVRDLLLDEGSVDLDLVAEGDVSEIANRVAKVLHSRVVQHSRFLTAAVIGADFRVDMATARREGYPRPGSLPVVSPATISEDLSRRDFSINAMALPLAPRAASVIDPFGGREDLAQGEVRVLHEHSFQDDPTRSLRAARYAGRYSFRLERQTARWLRRDLSATETVSGPRLRREIELISAEHSVDRIVRLAGRIGIWEAIDPALLVPRARTLRRLNGLQRARRDAVLLSVLLMDASPRARTRCCERLALTRRQREVVEGFATLWRNRAKLSRPSLRPSRVVALLQTANPDAVEALVAVEGGTLAGRRARRYLDEWRHIRPLVGGGELLTLGLRPGPAVGRALAAVRSARLDGNVRTKSEEVALALKTASTRR
jgi:tRNA nucleotidyltransferase (CCA-adding enzyme)